MLLFLSLNALVALALEALSARPLDVEAWPRSRGTGCRDYS